MLTHLKTSKHVPFKFSVYNTVKQLKAARYGMVQKKVQIRTIQFTIVGTIRLLLYQRAITGLRIGYLQGTERTFLALCALANDTKIYVQTTTSVAYHFLLSLLAAPCSSKKTIYIKNNFTLHTHLKMEPIPIDVDQEEVDESMLGKNVHFSPNEYITLVSSDFDFVISKRAASEAKMLREMLSSNTATTSIQLQAISPDILEMVCQYLMSKVTHGVSMQTFQPLTSLNMKLEEHRQMAIELLLAANYLEC